jgi:hypothetical protein
MLDDEEEKLYSGHSMFDKGILGAIWGVSFIYGVMTEQVLSKKVDLPCSVSDKSEKTFGFASIFLAIIIGPVMVTILHIIISIVNILMKHDSIAADIRKVELQNILSVCFS